MKTLNQKIFLAKKARKYSVTLSIKEAEAVKKKIEDMDFTISWLMDRLNDNDYKSFTEWLSSGRGVSQLPTQ